MSRISLQCSHEWPMIPKTVQTAREVTSEQDTSIPAEVLRPEDPWVGAGDKPGRWVLDSHGG